MSSATFKEQDTQFCACAVDGYSEEPVEFCPLHAAAPEMLALLRTAEETLSGILEDTDTDDGDRIRNPYLADVRALIAKIDGDA